jgi:hypothetical protein
MVEAYGFDVGETFDRASDSGNAVHHTAVAGENDRKGEVAVVDECVQQFDGR